MNSENYTRPVNMQKNIRYRKFDCHLQNNVFMDQNHVLFAVARHVLFAFLKPNTVLISLFVISTSSDIISIIIVSLFILT